MKKITLLCCLLLAVSLLAGCAGTPVVYYSDCTCPVDAHVEPQTPAAEPAAPEAPAAEGALKTGLALVTGLGKSASASAEGNGKADYDVTMVAVLVDDNGVIQDCKIDGIAASVEFDTTGAIVSDLTAPVLTKNEKGADYNMVAWGGAIAEWDAQAAALASFAKGKTVEELKNGAVDETGYAPEGSDLATSATIYLGGYVSAIEQAAVNAQHLGAQAGDGLKLAVLSKISGSTPADAENAGNAQLDADVTALTVRDGVITSCIIDAVQAKVAFDQTGTVTSDLSVPVQTKNQLGENYGMVAWGGAVAEWNEQAASFASYITGKTAEQVMGIAIDEATKPTEADLSTSVTISIGGFQALIQKAAQ
nr:hypothetical protein [Oscillospiraceae bacterium]